jgi:hypothetical protein
VRFNLAEVGFADSLSKVNQGHEDVEPAEHTPERILLDTPQMDSSPFGTALVARKYAAQQEHRLQQLWEAWDNDVDMNTETTYDCQGTPQSYPAVPKMPTHDLFLSPVTEKEKHTSAFNDVVSTSRDKRENAISCGQQLFYRAQSSVHRPKTKISTRIVDYVDSPSIVFHQLPTQSSDTGIVDYEDSCSISTLESDGSQDDELRAHEDFLNNLSTLSEQQDHEDGFISCEDGFEEDLFGVYANKIDDFEEFKREIEESREVLGLSLVTPTGLEDSLVVFREDEKVEIGTLGLLMRDQLPLDENHTTDHSPRYHNFTVDDVERESLVVLTTRQLEGGIGGDDDDDDDDDEDDEGDVSLRCCCCVFLRVCT